MKKLMMLLCVLAGFNNLAAMQVDGKDAGTNASEAKKPTTDREWVHIVLQLTQNMAKASDAKALELSQNSSDEQAVIIGLVLQAMRAAHQYVAAFKQAMEKISDEDLVTNIRAAHAKARNDHVMQDAQSLKTFDSIQAAVGAIKAFGEQAVKDTDALVKKFDVQFNTVIVVTAGADAESDDDLGASDAGESA